MVPSLRDCVALKFLLPGAAAPGFPMPPLRGWSAALVSGWLAIT